MKISNYFRNKTNNFSELSPPHKSTSYTAAQEKNKQRNKLIEKNNKNNNNQLIIFNITQKDSFTLFQSSQRSQVTS